MIFVPKRKEEFLGLLQWALKNKLWNESHFLLEEILLSLAEQEGAWGWPLAILGRILHEKGDDSQSQFCLRVSLDRAREGKDCLLESLVLIQMAWSHIAKDRNDKGRMRGQKSQKVLQSVREESDLLVALQLDSLEVLMVACENLGEQKAHEKYRRDMEGLLISCFPPNLLALLPPIPPIENPEPMAFDELKKKVNQWKNQPISSPTEIAPAEEPPTPPTEMAPAEEPPAPFAEESSPVESPSTPEEAELEEDLRRELEETSVIPLPEDRSDLEETSLMETVNLPEDESPEGENDGDECLIDGFEPEEGSSESPSALGTEEGEEGVRTALGHIRDNRLTKAMKALPSLKDQGASDPSSSENQYSPKEQISQEEKVRQSEELLSKGLFKKAKQEAEEVLKINPQHRRAKKVILLAGELRLVMERLLSRAFQLEENGHLSEALREWQKILEMAPGHPKILQNIKSLREKLDRALEQRLVVLLDLYEQRKFRLVLAKGQELLKIDPKNPDCLQIMIQVKENLKEGENLLLQAQKAFQNGDLNKATSLAKKVLELDPKKEEAHKILREIQGPDPLDSALEKRKRKEADQLVASSSNLLEMKMPEEAYRIVRVALELDPGRSDGQDILKTIEGDHPEIRRKVESSEETHQIFSADPTKTTPAETSPTSHHQNENQDDSKTKRDEKNKGPDLELEEMEFTRLLQKRKATRIFQKPPAHKAPPSVPNLPSPPSSIPKAGQGKSRKHLLAFFEEAMEEKEE